MSEWLLNGLASILLKYGAGPQEMGWVFGSLTIVLLITSLLLLIPTLIYTYRKVKRLL